MALGSYYLPQYERQARREAAFLIFRHSPSNDLISVSFADTKRKIEELVNIRRPLVPVDHGSNFHLRDTLPHSLPVQDNVSNSTTEAALVHSEPQTHIVAKRAESALRVNDTSATPTKLSQHCFSLQRGYRFQNDNPHDSP